MKVDINQRACSSEQVKIISSYRIGEGKVVGFRLAKDGKRQVVFDLNRSMCLMKFIFITGTNNPETHLVNTPNY